MGKPVQSENRQGRVEIGEVTVADVIELVRWLRPADREEIDALGYNVALEGVWTSVVQSEEAYCVFYEDDPAFIFGVATQNDGSGFIWAVGTEDVESFPVYFARESRNWIKVLAQGYDYLWTRSYADNHVHHRWLEWCGFEFMGEVNLPPHGLPFKTYVYMSN